VRDPDQIQEEIEIDTGRRESSLNVSPPEGLKRQKRGSSLEPRLAPGRLLLSMMRGSLPRARWLS
jgi:hypothetical protein